MTPPPTPHRVRGRWIVAGVVVWLILACSISLESSRPGIAQGGGITLLGVIALVLLTVTLRGAARSVRAGVRLLRRHARDRR